MTVASHRFQPVVVDIFLTPAEFDAIPDKIAYTEFGGYRYCCRPDDIKPRTTYVVTEDGYENLVRDENGRYTVIGIRMRRPSALRAVPQDRIDRDRDRFVLPMIEYQYVIENHWSDLDPLYDCLDTLVVDLFHLDRHLQWRGDRPTHLLSER